MTELENILRENTDYFYYRQEQAVIEETLFYQELYDKSVIGIQQNISMFDDMGVDYLLTNQKGKAILVTEVVLFKEAPDDKLILTLVGEYKDEGVDVYYSSYLIEAKLERFVPKTVFNNELSLSLEYSNKILEIVEGQTGETFINNFDTLYLPQNNQM